MGKKPIRRTNLDLETINTILPANFLALSKEERRNALNKIDAALDLVKLRMKPSEYNPQEVFKRERELRFFIAIIRRNFT